MVYNGFYIIVCVFYGFKACCMNACDRSIDINDITSWLTSQTPAGFPVMCNWLTFEKEIQGNPFILNWSDWMKRIEPAEKRSENYTMEMELCEASNVPLM